MQLWHSASESPAASQKSAKPAATAVLQEDHPGYSAMVGTSGLNAVNLTFMPVQFEVGTRQIIG